MNAAATFLVSESLCSTCNNASDCIYLQGAASPIWRCEEFDDSVAAPKQSWVALEVGNEPPQARSKLQGICSNCDNLGTCHFPKPEGGIWHCEEYR